MLENEEPIVNKFTQLVHYFINWFKWRFTLRCNIWRHSGLLIGLNQHGYWSNLGARLD